MSFPKKLFNTYFTTYSLLIHILLFCLLNLELKAIKSISVLMVQTACSLTLQTLLYLIRSSLMMVLTFMTKKKSSGLNTCDFSVQNCSSLVSDTFSLSFPFFRFFYLVPFYVLIREQVEQHSFATHELTTSRVNGQS